MQEWHISHITYHMSHLSFHEHSLRTYPRGTCSNTHPYIINRIMVHVRFKSYVHLKTNSLTWCLTCRYAGAPHLQPTSEPTKHHNKTKNSQHILSNKNTRQKMHDANKHVPFITHHTPPYHTTHHHTIRHTTTHHTPHHIIPCCHACHRPRAHSSRPSPAAAAPAGPPPAPAPAPRPPGNPARAPSSE